ncbi:MAG: hypothetical protein H0V26_05960 [Solirubrobacterales bacterium]|nr:hypothetical protein [Solirubrobacterales bacterium]
MDEARLQLSGMSPQVTGAPRERGDEAVYALLVGGSRGARHRERRRADHEYARVDAAVEGV